MPRTPQPYERPAAGEPVIHEVEIKRSRFIAWVARAAEEDQARELVERARAQHPDARHYCSAFIVDGAEPNPIERSSDDGEPSGTAGTPMLDVLRGSGMRDVAAVVIRYFGGVKLGAGGLVHAYSNTLAGAIDHVPRVRREVKELAEVSLPHADAGRVEAELRRAGVEVLGTTYAAMATHTLAFDPGQRERVDALIAAATHGNATARSAGHEWVEAAVQG